MRLIDVETAIAEAKQFIRKAGALIDSDEARDMMPADAFYGSKNSAAVKRASMDLTRALAEMRKP